MVVIHVQALSLGTPWVRALWIRPNLNESFLGHPIFANHSRVYSAKPLGDLWSSARRDGALQLPLDVLSVLPEGLHFPRKPALLIVPLAESSLRGDLGASLERTYLVSLGFLVAEAVIVAATPGNGPALTTFFGTGRGG